MAQPSDNDYYQDIMSPAGVSVGNRDESKAIRQLAIDNLLQHTANSMEGGAAQRKYNQYLMSPEEMREMRAKALQSISRGQVGLSTPGKYAGMDTSDIAGLTNFIGGNKPMNYGGIEVQGGYNPAGMMASAQERGKYNEQAGLGLLNKVAPELLQQQAQAHADYNSPLNLFNQADPRLLAHYAESKLSEDTGAMGIAERAVALSKATGGTGAIDYSRPGMFGTSQTKVTAPYEAKAQISGGTPEERSNNARFIAPSIVPNANDWEPTKVKNNQLLEQANEYQPNSFYDPKVFARRKADFDKKVANVDFGVLSGLFANKKVTNPDQLYLNPGSLWDEYGSKTNITPAEAKSRDAMKQVMIGMPLSVQQQMVKTMLDPATGAINVGSMKNFMNDAAPQVTRDYTVNRILNAVGGNEMPQRGAQSLDAVKASLNRHNALFDNTPVQAPGGGSMPRNELARITVDYLIKTEGNSPDLLSKINTTLNDFDKLPTSKKAK